MDPKIFKGFYQREYEGGDSLQINIQSLLVRDSHGMTRLHRAAMNDDEQTVDQILQTIRFSCLSNETEAKKWGKEVLHNVIASAEKGVTPLYVAAACEHENLCQKMLNFLKEMLSDGELRKYLTDTNGFLGDASWNAIDWNKDEIMFQIVLKSFQNFLGQGYLIALMKAANQTYKGCNRECRSFKREYRSCNHKKWFEIVLEVTANVENGNKLLFDLLFQNTSSCLYKQLQHIDNKRFQEMISVNELEAFMELLFGIDQQKAMHFVVYEILDKFTDKQRVRLCRILIKEESYGKSYFNRWWFDSIEGFRRYYMYYILQKVLKCISDNLGQRVVNDLLVNNEHEIIKRVLRYGGLEDAKLVDFMLTFLFNKEEEKIHHMMTIVMQLIEKITENCKKNSTRNALGFVCPRVEKSVKESDLREFVDLITNIASIESKEINIWIDYLVERGNATSVDKFLKCVLDKLGQSAVEKLVKNEAVTQVLKIKDGEKVVNALLRHLSKEKQEEIELEVIKNAPATLKTLIDTKKWFDEAELFWWNILHLQYVTKYADRDVLQKLIDIVTQLYMGKNCYGPYSKNIYDKGGFKNGVSVWRNHLLNNHHDLRPENVDKFLLCVSDKLGKNKVKELVLHTHTLSGVRRSVIYSANFFGDKGLVKAMLAHLTKEDRQEIQRDHVDSLMDDDDDYDDY
jgi:hypothetical protein